MSGKIGPDIVNFGLIQCCDAANRKSALGEPTSNIYNSIANTYPTASNGWATYLAYTGTGHNLYNGGSPFTITVSGVSGNEVTSPSHPFLTYDAVQPQTTGGGLTAGTNYFIKKTGTNTFTIHAYDGTDNGSKGLDAYGFAVHNSVNTDTRISINATGFPTSWWGYPHLPNSQCVKQIIPNGFDYKGTKHDCIRLHFFRTDLPGDESAGGMAYGVFPTIGLSTDYTYSWWWRIPDHRGNGKYLSNTHYVDDADHGGVAPYSPAGGTVLPVTADVGKWQRHQHSFTSSGTASGNFYSYWMNANANSPWAIDIAEIQFEAKSDHATRFTPTSRSATSSLLDLSGKAKHLSDFGNVIHYDSNSVVGFFDLDSSAKAFQYGAALTLSTTCTVALVMATSDTASVWVRGNANNSYYLAAQDGGGDWYHGSCGTPSMYVNLVPSTNPTSEGYLDDNWRYWEAKNVDLSAWTSFDWFRYVDGGYSLAASVAMLLVYDRNLTAAESAQNFAAIKKRFGI